MTFDFSVKRQQPKKFILYERSVARRLRGFHLQTRFPHCLWCATLEAQRVPYWHGFHCTSRLDDDCYTRDDSSGCILGCVYVA
jgi:hypothetical protein